jgi:TetR/AcrR family transcriptional repressor of uid operon
MVAVQHELSGRDRILATARELFAIQGFHQTSMAELAASAQISVGQIYRSFKSKDEIIAAIVDGDRDSRVIEMTAICDRLKTGQITIEAAFEDLVLTAHSSKKDALSFDILAEAFRNPVVGLTITNLCLRYKALLREFACIANPSLSSEALDAAEEVILACLFGLGHRSLSKPALGLEQTATRAAAMLLAALRYMD